MQWYNTVHQIAAYWPLNPKRTDHFSWASYIGIGIVYSWLQIDLGAKQALSSILWFQCIRSRKLEKNKCLLASPLVTRYRKGPGFGKKSCFYTQSLDFAWVTWTAVPPSRPITLLCCDSAFGFSVRVIFFPIKLKSFKTHLSLTTRTTIYGDLICCLWMNPHNSKVLFEGYWRKRGRQQ